MLVLLPICPYAALLLSIGPTARRLRPLLVGLTPMDQRITAADLRAVRKTVSIREHLMLGVSQAMVAAALVVLAI
jgi:hypothetical protein